jgi:hypothetical protein
VLDSDELEDGANLIEVAAYTDLLRFIIAENVLRIPALGISDSGDLLAAWWDTNVEARLFAKFSRPGLIDLTFTFKGKPFRVSSPLGEVRATLHSVGFSDAVLDGEG